MSLKTDLQQSFQTISEFRKADLFYFKADIDNENFIHLVNQINSLKTKRENCALFLVTHGGDANDAYKIAKLLTNKKNYAKFILFVFGFCKSAGTLLALSADEIVMGESGELGPLDVQIQSEEAISMDSAMNTLQSLELLSEQASRMFVKCLDGIIKNSQNQYRIDQGYPAISVKVAESVAENIVKELLRPISSQIDPQRFVTLHRKAKVVEEYATRLNLALENAGIIEHLIRDYPSHEFIINQEEAKRIFGCTGSKPKFSVPEPIEQKLSSYLESAYSYAVANIETLINEMPDDSYKTGSQILEDKRNEQSDDKSEE